MEGPAGERRRREDRGAEWAERVGCGEGGYSPPSRLESGRAS